MFWEWFIGTGFMLFCVFIFALCKVAGEADDWMERIYKEHLNADKERDFAGDREGQHSD
jgi:hypothetical protein